MLLILLGEDDFSKGQELDGIRRDLGDLDMLAANTVTLEGRQVTPDELRSVCLTLPFLAEKRLVIITGLLDRFENSRGNGRRRRNQVEPGQTDECKTFADCIAQVPDSTVLVLIDTRVRSSNPLLSAISGGARVKTFPVLKGDRLRQWIRRRVATEGGSITLEAAEILAELVGGDLWLMDNEVKKLVLYTSGRRIEASDVGLVTSHGQEANVFTMVDAIFEFKARVAEQLLSQLLQRGAAPAYLMTMLSRQIQLIIRAKEMLSQRQKEAEIQYRLGLSAEFALRRTLAQATRFSSKRLQAIYHKLLETDLAIKTGKRDAEMALTILVAELCQR